MNVVQRFFNYVSHDTQSNSHHTTVPSTPGQRVLAQAIAAELTQMGMHEVEVDTNGYLMATLPANTTQPKPVVGFIAHLDTSPDFSGANVQPRMLRYEGGEIVLNEKRNMRLSPHIFPELNQYQGQELIVTDGTTLLGADNKAGVAAIVSAMQFYTQHPEIPHGKIRIAFTPDEEIGRGADCFDVARFGCEWAYTIDGGEIGEIEYENFHAAEATIHIRGLNIHPGYAKNKMINAIQVAMELNQQLPPLQRPEHTCGYEGFFHATSCTGTVEAATINYIIRDHHTDSFEAKKQTLRLLVNQMNDKYPHCLTLEIKEQYKNMHEIIVSRMDIIIRASQAMQAVGVEPRIKPIRGGTDGARLSFMGLPCPNLFAGGLNFHGPYEFLPVNSLIKSMETIIEIIKSI